jgi:diadenosine tetraphosphate (Ap4A) HIT family hydrolase
LFDGRETPVAEDERFVAWVSYGALVEGHLLVVPRRHTLSLSQLDPDEMEALHAFVSSVQAVLSDHYGPTCAFEHGPVEEGTQVGCTVDHAHLHLMPWSSSLVEAAIEDFPELPWRATSSLAAGLHEAADEAYLLVRDADGRTAIATSSEIPSQALRRTIAARLGKREEWDWKKNPRRNTVRRTLSRLLHQT